ncbi:MAG: alpha/beta hydrolase, partial [Myxococcales bacterium]
MPSYRTRQLITAALAANAVRPSRGRIGSVPSFFAGWLTSELAPHLLAMTAADTAVEVTRRRRKGTGSGPLGLLAAGAAAGALGYLIAGSRTTAASVESTLERELGRSYLDRFEDAQDDDRVVTTREWARPFRLRDAEVEVIRDINYTKGGRRARLDIYRAKGVDLTDAPVLIQIHGGAWTIGSKEQQGLILMNRMAKRGWICVSVNYRLAPKHPWPAMIDDVRTSIEWVRENIASYGGNPEYLVTTGGSAGGHLSSLAALTVPGIAACVPFYGVYDMANLTDDKFAKGMRDHFLAPRVFFTKYADDPQAFIDASPLAHVGPDAPDFFVLHGSNDTLVNVNQARAFVDKLRSESNATVTYHELPGAQHAFEVF